jgi:hypothetical protein
MAHPLFVAHWKMMPKLQAEEMLDAATAASVPHMGKEVSNWWDRMVARARGVVRDVAGKLEPMFTWNRTPVNSSAGLRRAFAEGIEGSRVES